MKLARVAIGGNTTSAVLIDDHWVRIATLLPGVDTTTGALGAQDRLRDAIAQFRTEQLTEENSVPADGAELALPLDDTRTIWAIGLNYRDHAEEAKMPLPERPLLFGKGAGALTGPFARVELPTYLSAEFDYEVELAVVLAADAKNVSAEAASGVIGGYAVADDLSTRDLQLGDGQWVRSKSFDGFCPVGPWITTADEAGDPHALAIRCWVNGELRQDSRTDQLVFRIPEIVSYLSQSTSLRAGDIILTGTPPGVAMGRDDKPWLKAGDVVRCEIEGLGSIENELVPASTRPVQWREGRAR